MGRTVETEVTSFMLDKIFMGKMFPLLGLYSEVWCYSNWNLGFEVCGPCVYPQLPQASNSSS